MKHKLRFLKFWIFIKLDAVKLIIKWNYIISNDVVALIWLILPKTRKQL